MSLSKSQHFWMLGTQRSPQPGPRPRGFSTKAPRGTERTERNGANRLAPERNGFRAFFVPMGWVSLAKKHGENHGKYMNIIRRMGMQRENMRYEIQHV